MAEPVSLAEAKAHLRVVDDTSEDTLISGYITAARGWVENYTGRILMQREVSEEHAGFSRFFELRWQPFQADTVTIAYTDSDGADAEVVDLIANGRRVYPAYGAWWPSTRLNTGVRLTYTAGYDEGEVPQELKQAILLLVGTWFDRRESASDQPLGEVPFAVTALCDQYRSAVL